MPELLQQPTIETDLRTFNISPDTLDDDSHLRPEEQTTDSPDGLPLACVASLATTQEVALDLTPQAEQAMTLKEKFFRSRIGRAALTGLTALGLAGGMAVMDAAPAFAESGPVYTVVNPDNDSTRSIYDRNSPSWSDSTRKAPDFSYYGDRLELICGTNGEAVGPYNNRRWHYAQNLSRPEAGFTWIPDRYLNTPNKANQRTPGERECGGKQEQAPQIQNPNFNRSAGVNWALGHAQDPQTNGEGCAKFISHALWNSGFPQTKDWNNRGGYWSGPTYFDGTVTANATKPLLDYLKQHYPTIWQPLGHMNSGNNAVPLAQPGDIIAYSWSGGGAIDHVAFVVGSAKDNPNYPLVAEWGQFDWSENFGISGLYKSIKNPRAPYAERGWTWSVMNNQWLQSEKGNKNMTAYLLHINGGYFAPSF